MNRVRNWVLIGLAFALALGALVWNEAFSLPSGVTDPGWEPAPDEGEAILLWAMGVLPLAAGAFASFVLWFAFSNRDMNRLTGGAFLTPVWTLVLFIPLVQFVALYAMAQHIRQAQIASGRTGLHPMVLFIFMWLLIPIGITMAQVQMQRIDWGVRPSWSASFHQEFRQWRVVAPDEATPQGPHGDPGSWLTLHEEVVPEGSGDGVVPHAEKRVRSEVVPMPASAVAACFFSFASVPLGLLGPAGLASSIAGLYSRERFLDLQSREPGHRGGRVVSWLHWVALGGMAVSFMVSVWMATVLLAT